MMTRAVETGLVAIVFAAAFAAFPTGCQSGGIGDPCVPEDEYDPGSPGFVVTEENIESRSFQCQTRICLVNHFQGRTSCPLGQAPLAAPGEPGRHACAPGDASACAAGEECVPAIAPTPSCDPEAADGGASACLQHGGSCNAERRTCQCAKDEDCAPGFVCDPEQRNCRAYLCHSPGSCQRAGASFEENTLPSPLGPGAPRVRKDCCVPGSDTPVVPSVCGQCDDESNRNAVDAVYCSCRCGPAADAPDDGTDDYCECPAGFACEEIRPYVGFGDPLLAGKYCIKEGSRYAGEAECGSVDGFWSGALCSGLAAP